MSMQVHMPNLCMKCGKNPPSITHTVQQKRADFSPMSLVTIFLGRVVIESQTLTLQVPLCETCKRALDAQRRRRQIVIGLGILMVVGGLLWLLMGRLALANIPIPAGKEGTSNIEYQRQYQTLNMQFWFASLPIVIGLLIAMIGNMLMGRPRFVSTDGKIFRFYNKTFHEAFARLNPDLVKQPRNRG